MANSKKLDQWYTKDNVAQKCVEKMVKLGYIKEMVDVIEPACGEGAFLRALDKEVDESYIHAYDLDPKTDRATTQDWLKYESKFFGSKPVIVGNPPYGKKAKLAVEFINHSLDVGDVVGFIVPITLSTSYTAQRKVRKDASLVYEMKLPKNSFVFEGKNVDVPSIFQIWVKVKPNLRLEKPQTEHDAFTTRIYNKTETAKKQLKWDWDIAIQRNSKKGGYILRGEDATDERHWILIKCSDEKALDIFKSVDWSKVNDNKMTAGMGKADIVKAYLNNGGK